MFICLLCYNKEVRAFFLDNLFDSLIYSMRDSITVRVWWILDNSYKDKINTRLFVYKRRPRLSTTYIRDLRLTLMLIKVIKRFGAISVINITLLVVFINVMQLVL